MSMHPVTPGNVNAAIACTMSGGVATAKLVGSLISGLARYRWIESSSASYCRFVVELSRGTRIRTLELAATWEHAELKQAQASLRKWADDSHAHLAGCFEPDSFREEALVRLRGGDSPKVVAHECVAEHFQKLLNYLDKVQSMRMKRQSDEWRRVEDFKQSLVNNWGENGFDISRSGGRESNYFLRKAAIVVAKCIAYPLFGMFVVGTGLAVALEFRIWA